MNMCSDDSRMIMRYQACADVKGSETSVKEVQCFGSWKEGSTFYFLGMLNDSHVRQDNYEGRFRCFAYQKIFNGFKLSQSGDAGCDIWSPEEGYVTMKINKVSSPGDECRLPDWVLVGKHSKYLSLDKSQKYNFDTMGNSTVTVTTGPDTSDDPYSTKKLTCSRLVKSEANFSRMIMQVNFDCESGFICLELTRKSPSVIATKLGRLSRNPDEACDQSLFFDAELKSTLLVSDYQKLEVCPLVGKYSLGKKSDLTAESAECSNGTPNGHLSFGCSGETSFKLHNHCQRVVASDSEFAKNTFQEQ